MPDSKSSSQTLPQSSKSSTKVKLLKSDISLPPTQATHPHPSKPPFLTSPSNSGPASPNCSKSPLQVTSLRASSLGEINPEKTISILGWLSRIVLVSGRDQTKAEGIQALKARVLGGKAVDPKLVKYWENAVATPAWQKVFARDG